LRRNGDRDVVKTADKKREKTGGKNKKIQASWGCAYGRKGVRRGEKIKGTVYRLNTRKMLR